MTITATLDAPTKLRRVRRAESPYYLRPDPYASLMACWMDYMRSDERDLSASRVKLHSDPVDGEGFDRCVFDEQRAADMKIGEAVNAMVDSLTVQQRWAIYRSQGISTAWRFQNASYVDVLTEARSELEKKLQKNIATRIFFV